MTIESSERKQGVGENSAPDEVELPIATYSPRNDIIRFFLSKDFNAFTRVKGKYILTRLQKEIADLEESFGFVKTARAVLLLESEKAAETFLKSGKVPAEEEERIRLILSQLQEMQEDLPIYARQLLPVPRYEDLLAEAITAKGGKQD